MPYVAPSFSEDGISWWREDRLLFAAENGFDKMVEFILAKEVGEKSKNQAQNHTWNKKFKMPFRTVVVGILAIIFTWNLVVEFRTTLL